MVSSRVRIEPANLRDCTYIGANLREEDRREIMCQLPDDVSGAAMAASVFAGAPEPWTRIASLDGQPVAAFGFMPFTVPVWLAWAWGTKLLPRVAPAITRWCWEEEQQLLELGVRRVEVRTIEGHHQAHRWLESLGCKRVCDLPDHGRNGELFHLYAWTIGDGRPSQRHRYRTTNHVFQNASSPEGADATSASEPAVEGSG